MGVVAGISLLVGIEALARGLLLAFLVTALALMAAILIIEGLLREWRLTLAILLAIGAVVLLWQNLRELHSGEMPGRTVIAGSPYTPCTVQILLR